jgi:thiamine-phosphate diphosphorylase
MALNRLYFVTMDSAGAGSMDGVVRGPLEQVEAACRAGIRLIQLRMKEASDDEFLQTAREAKKICAACGCLMIINDRVEVAVAADADGVHVGQEDMPVRDARLLLGEGKIVGGTANTLEDIREHYLGGADYIGLGPYRYTTTKKKLSPILGLEGYRRVMRGLEAEGILLPVFAIGGIGVPDVGLLLEAGVYGVAFSGLLVQARDREELVRQLEGEVAWSGAVVAEAKNIKTI